MASATSSSRAALAALCTTPTMALAMREPPATPARGSRESPSVTVTRSSGTPNTSAAVWARTV